VPSDARHLDDLIMHQDLQAPKSFGIGRCKVYKCIKWVPKCHVIVISLIAAATKIINRASHVYMEGIDLASFFRTSGVNEAIDANFLQIPWLPYAFENPIEEQKQCNHRLGCTNNVS